MARTGKLRDELRFLIEQQKLDDAERVSLLKNINKPPISRRPLWMIAAAIVPLAAVLTVWFISPASESHNDVLWRMAEEVSTNHTRIKPLDVTDSSLETLRAQLSMLDFSLQTSSLIEGLELVGGRYCTLQGAIATQLVFRDSQGNRITLYQASYDSARFGSLPDLDKQQRPATVVRQGLEIKVWQQSGVLLALASAESEH